MAMLVDVSAGLATEKAMEQARSGQAEGWCAVERATDDSAAAEQVALAAILRPGVAMGNFQALPYVVAMGAVDAFRAWGCVSNVGIQWPSTLVCGAPAFTDELARVRINAGAGEGGMFAVATLVLDVAAFASLELDVQLPDAVEPLVNAIVARVDAWGAALGPKQSAGPLAPVLNEYFDMVPMLGHQVAVCGPNGHALDTGTFAGLDIWGRATVLTPAGEREYPAEAVTLHRL